MRPEFEAIQQLADVNPELITVGKGQPVETIAKAEQYLGVTFPESYKEFLRTWGNLAVGPLEFYGLCGDNFEDSGVPDAIWFTARKRRQLNLPSHLVVVLNHDGDEYDCLDTSHTRDGECPVVAWDTNSGQVNCVRGKTFAMYVLQDIRDFLE